MRPACLVLLLALGPSLWALDPVLGAATELALNPPWSQTVRLEFSEEGPYRLEATGLGGEPVEVVVERRGFDGAWTVEATNRALRGNLDAITDFAVAAGESWRVRPLRAVSTTVVLRLRRSSFADLRTRLKIDLTPGPEVSLPLRKRAELPLGTGGTGLSAATGTRGELWLAWLTAQGTAAEVWNAATGTRLGSPIAASRTGPWESLALEGGGDVTFIGVRQGENEARVWNGQEWRTEAAPPVRNLTTPQGTFRFQTLPTVRVWRARAGGWADLELPQDRMLDRLLLGPVDGGLFAFLASSSGRERSFYLWTARDGWTAQLPPPADGPPRADLWSATSSAGSVYVVEGRGIDLVLRQFDGSAWRQPLDLGVLAPTGVLAVALLPPSPWSKSGSLVVASNRVAVYDLP